MLGFCSSVEFSFFILFYFLILIFNLSNLLLLFLHLFLCFLFLLFFSPCNQSFTYINLVYLPLFNSEYPFSFSFSSSLSIYLLVLFLLLYPPIGTLLLFSSLCFCQLCVVDVIFGFLCMPGQSIVLYFCWTVLISIMGVYVYMYIQSHFIFLF